MAAGAVMTADLLREAAALMRKRAVRMPPGPYGMSSQWTTPTTMRSRVTKAGALIAEVRGKDSDGSGVYTVDYFSSWHPLVALAVADWLDAQAERSEIGFTGKTHKHALAVARVYLGRVS